MVRPPQLSVFSSWNSSSVFSRGAAADRFARSGETGDARSFCGGATEIPIYGQGGARILMAESTHGVSWLALIARSGRISNMLMAMHSTCPAILRQLETRPSYDGNSVPWFSIWSALAHQATFTQLRLQRFLISCEFSQPPLPQHRSSISSFRPGSRCADSGTNLPTRAVYPLTILKL